MVYKLPVTSWCCRNQTLAIATGFSLHRTLIGPVLVWWAKNDWWSRGICNISDLKPQWSRCLAAAIAAHNPWKPMEWLIMWISFGIIKVFIDLSIIVLDVIIGVLEQSKCWLELFGLVYHSGRRGCWECCSVPMTAHCWRRIIIKTG